MISSKNQVFSEQFSPMGGGKTLIINTLFFTTKKDNGKQCNKLRDYITWKEVHCNQEKIRITQTLSIK
jgi:hypothetical protein